MAEGCCYTSKQLWMFCWHVFLAWKKMLMSKRVKLPALKCEAQIEMQQPPVASTTQQARARSGIDLVATRTVLSIIHLSSTVVLSSQPQDLTSRKSSADEDR